MEEYNIEIEIDEDGNICAETKGFSGQLCESELDNVLASLQGEKVIKNKPEYYKKNKNFNIQNNSHR